MASRRSSTRQRLIDATLELFATQGVKETTTRQIAEKAGVNEVTLFRHFGNKHGLLLAAIENSGVFTHLGESLVQKANQNNDVTKTLKDYADGCLQALEHFPDLVRSMVGEAGQYPIEHRRAIGQGLTRANLYVAQYLETVIYQGQLKTYVPVEKLASLLHGMLLGYAVIEFTSEFNELWESRDDFLEHLVEIFFRGAVSQLEDTVLRVKDRPKPRDKLLSNTSLKGCQGKKEETANKGGSIVAQSFPKQNLSIQGIADLPAGLIHGILNQAKASSLQDYALAYVLFGAGLSPVEIALLERSHQINDAHQHLLQVTYPQYRQVPVNQWISGKRYGSYGRNPLNQWLKSRQDDRPALFLNNVGRPISEAEVRERWQIFTTGLLTPMAQPPAIEQAQQTWCVEMLMKGIDLEDLSILTALDLQKLQPYARRAREKAALERAILLDHKPSSLTESKNTPKKRSQS